MRNPNTTGLWGSPGPIAARSVFAGAMMLLAGAAAPALAGHIFTILGRDLQARTVDVLRIADGRITFQIPREGSAKGPEQSMAMADVAAIVEPGWWSIDGAGANAPRLASDRREALSLSVVELTDGRVIAGKVEGEADPTSADGEPAEPPKDLLRWEHPVLGKLEFKLDEVRRVRLGGGPERSAQPNGAEAPPPGEAPAKLPDAGVLPERDAAILANGDRVSGFVERLGREVWISESKVLTKLPIGVVREVRLVNPPLTQEGERVWLQGGTTARVEFIGSDPQKGMFLGIEPAPGKSRQVAIRTELVRAIVPAAERLRSLSALTISRQAPAADRPYGAPARVLESPDPLLGARDVELPGPMEVSWLLPAGAARVAGWIVMPPACLRWGDCVVRIQTLSEDGRSTLLADERLNAAKPGAPVNAPIRPDAKTLRVSVEAGESGPIQDRVILRRFLVVSGGKGD